MCHKNKCSKNTRVGKQHQIAQKQQQQQQPQQNNNKRINCNDDDDDDGDDDDAKKTVIPSSLRLNLFLFNLFLFYFVPIVCLMHHAWAAQ